MARPLVEHFADLKDPRVNRTKKHRLDDILVIALSALLCGATTFEDIEEFAESREEWFRTFLPLPHGIPSHDTIYRVFCALDAKVFARCFAGWMAEVGEALGLNGLTHIAVDGKSLRGATGNTFTGCVHVVTAWATEHGLMLGQEVVADKSNEIPAFPVLLKTLKLKGALVTIDAAGCQTEVVEAIRDGGGDYLLSVKGNQSGLLAAVEAVVADAVDKEFEGVGATHHDAMKDGHGRHEERYATAIPTPDGVLPEVWRDVAAVVLVTRERTENGKTERSAQYFITSRDVSAAILAGLMRRHWAIENECHWVLDVMFGEDANRTADRNAAANLGVVRRAALGILKRDQAKISKPRKAFRAALNTDYLEKLLRGNAVI
jgi:predicted transposase YbfD/YdcC